MISDALKVEIVRYADEARRSNAVFTAASAGRLTPADAARYVASLLTLVQHTPVYLARARDRALARGQTRLVRHFEHKLDEEKGHDAWAEADLARLAERFGVATPAEAVPAVKGLLAFIENSIDRDPTLYLSYILFVEYVTVLLGPEFMAHAEERCGIPRAAFSIIGNHVELDVGHVEEGLDAIDELVGDASQLPAMRATLQGSIAWFERLCAQAVERAPNEKRPGDSHRPAA